MNEFEKWRNAKYLPSKNPLIDWMCVSEQEKALPLFRAGEKSGWLAAWKLALAKYRQHGCMCFEEIAEQEIAANEKNLP